MISRYEELAFQKNSVNVLRQFASAILVSSIEDADKEFYENDYHEWKKMRKKRLAYGERMKESDYKDEFMRKQNCKEILSLICGVDEATLRIPEKNLREREFYEKNDMNTLSALTGYKKGTLQNYAKLHGWKIGSEYEKPTIFDL